jgi:hypothetical protein
VDLRGRLAAAPRVLARGPLSSVPSMSQSRRRSGSALKSSRAERCANAAISFAAFSTSSSWTISTGECM